MSRTWRGVVYKQLRHRPEYPAGVRGKHIQGISLSTGPFGPRYSFSDISSHLFTTVAHPCQSLAHLGRVLRTCRCVVYKRKEESQNRCRIDLFTFVFFPERAPFHTSHFNTLSCPERTPFHLRCRNTTHSELLRVTT